MAPSAVAVLGGGAWGTALAVSLAERGHPVRLWIREAELVSRMRERHDNPTYLPGVPIPPAVVPTNELGAALEGSALCIAAVPSPFARRVYEEAANGLSDELPLVVVTKGIEEGSLALPLTVAAEVLGAGRRLAVLSGPSFAADVARGLPTAVVAASTDPEWARHVQTVFSGRGLRVYTNEDPTGVQVAGALKNVVAIAAGAAEGCGLGSSVVAALVTRGLAEIRRLGQALGARPETFGGLAGLGDLVLTCTGERSRNRAVGLAIGRGERVEEILSHTSAVPEGVRTCRSARDLARRSGVEMPIVEEVHRLLFEGSTPSESLERLMSRPLRPEQPAAREKDR